MDVLKALWEEMRDKDIPDVFIPSIPEELTIPGADETELAVADRLTKQH